MSVRNVDLWRLASALCAALFVGGLFWGPLSELPRGEVVEELEQTAARMGLGGPTKGFHTQVLSVPSGAEITIQGKDRGQTPFFGNVSCRDGDKVVIKVQSKGFQPWVREPLCREGGTLEINARLDPEP